MTVAKVEETHILTIDDLADTESTVELMHPTRGKLGVSISMVGPDSDTFEVIGRQLHKKRGTKKESDMTEEEFIAENTEMLAGLMVGWSNDDFFKGEFTFERALAILKKHRWIRNQVDTALVNRKNFFLT